MDLIVLLKKVVMKMDLILNENGYDQKKAWEDRDYRLLKETSDHLSEGIQKVEKAKILNQSFVCVKNPYISENLEDYIDWKFVDQVKSIIN